MEKRGRGRPPITDDPKKTRSIRLKESEKKLIEGKHGSVQKWVEEKIKEEFGGVHEAEVVFKNRKKSKADFEVSEDDF